MHTSSGNSCSLLRQAAAIVLTACMLLTAGCAQPRHSFITNDSAPVELTLLTTNDLHGRLEPFNRYTDHGIESTGGLARLAARMDVIEQRAHGAVLRLNSGDTLSGPYNIHFGGETLFGALSLMGIDAAVPGNHEFDHGPQAFARALEHCSFSMVATNMEITPENALAGKIVPLLVLERSGMRVLIAGFTTPELEHISSPGPDVRVQDPASPHVRQKITRGIEQHSPDLVIALTHMGLEEDRRLARHIPEIDIICGGHSHDLLSSGQEIRVRHPDGRQTVIVQAGSGGAALGVLHIGLQPGAHPEYNWKPQRISASLPQCPRMLDFIASYQAHLPPDRGLTFTHTAIDSREETLRRRETPIGNFIADSLREYFNSDAALYNGGGIRGDCILPAGPLTVRDIETMLPFDNRAVVLSMSGEQLRQVLESSVAHLPRPWGGFLQISGLRIHVNLETPDDSGERIADVDILGEGGRYYPLEPERQYRIVTNTFLASGGNGYYEFNEAAAEPSTTGTAVRAIVMQRLAAQPRLRLTTDGRITVTTAGPKH
jgi:5'-nucleotidase / UDP-sugar diphosphatase